MVDNFKAKTEILLPPEMRNQEFKPVEFSGLIFYPEIFQEGRLVSYKSSLRNLRLKIIGTTLYLQNSLWKFYHGNNYQPFTYDDLVDAIKQLEDELQINSSNLEVIELEYGIVINADELDIAFNDFGKYRLYNPSYMTKQGRVYGVYYQNTTHKIKIYDKRFEAKRQGHNLPNELLRIEKRCKLKALVKTKNFQGIEANFLVDFKKRKVVEALFNDLVSSIGKLEIMDDTFYANLNPKQIRLLGYFQSTEARKRMKRFHLSTYKRDRLIFKEIKSKSTNKKYYEFLKLLDDQKKVIF